MKKCLGKLPPKHDERTLKLAKYLTEGLPPVPEYRDWSSLIPHFLMGLNDQLGDCTCAAIANSILTWTTDAQGSGVVIPDSEILNVYSQISGYDPKTGANDNGCCELDVLNYWRKTGVNGHKIVGYTQIDPKNQDHIKSAIDLFGLVYIGVELPESAMNQSEWVIVPGSKDAGGHCVILTAYSPETFTAISWGQSIPATKEWINQYCDEVYAIVTQDWIEKNGNSPSGFNLEQLLKDLAELN